jgi:hypothetical protein
VFCADYDPVAGAFVSLGFIANRGNDRALQYLKRRGAETDKSAGDWAITSLAVSGRAEALTHLQSLDSVDFGAAESPRIAVEPGGNALATWLQLGAESDPDPLMRVHAGRFVVGWGWLVTRRHDFTESTTADLGGATAPLSIDHSGRGLASWLDKAGLHVARFE